MSEQYQVIPIELIDPAEWNPRHAVDERALAELAASVESHGVIEPIIVRETNERFEVVAGSRRLAAAKRCELEHVPAIVRDVSSEDAAELSVIENVQNENLAPLDEAAAFLRLLSAGRKNGGVSGLARRMGKTRRFIHRRLALLELHEKCREALAAGAITIRHADRLAQIPKSKQAQALEFCTRPLFEGGVEVQVPAGVSELEGFIRTNFKAKVDAETVENYLPHLLADGGDDPAEIEKLLPVSEGYYVPDTLGKNHGLVERNDYYEIGVENHRFPDQVVPECEYTVGAVVLHGGPVRRLRVCAEKSCKVHRPRNGAQRTADVGSEPEQPLDDDGKPRELTAEEIAEREAEKKREEARIAREKTEQAREEDYQERKLDILKALAEHVKDVKFEDVIDLMWPKYEVAALCEVMGADWKLTAETLPQAIAMHHVMETDWNRAEFMRSAKMFGFKIPAKKKKPAPKKAAKPRKAKAKPADNAPDAGGADEAPQSDA